MTQQHIPRRQDQPIQIGRSHGYRIEGDHVFINAELQVPPFRPAGEWTLELWATGQLHREGPLTGIRVAQVALELPAPIGGPYVHQVDTRTPASLPLQGRAYAMVLALIQHPPEGPARVHAFANYPEPQTFQAPYLEGTVGYRVHGQEVVLEADAIFNPRHRANLSGTLSLELWAFPVSGPSTQGLRLAASEIKPVAGQSRLPAIERRVAFSEPPYGRFQMSLLLCEWTFAHGYVARDRRDFRRLFERSAPELPDASQPRSPVNVAASPVDRLRLVPPVVDLEAPTTRPEVAGAEAKVDVATWSEVPVAPSEALAEPWEAAQPDRRAIAAVAPPEEPTAPREASTPIARARPRARAIQQPREAKRPGARGLVSIQNATVEELSRVKGINLKIANEIIRSRPFTSLADLIRVRGLGQKTIERLKDLLTI